MTTKDRIPWPDLKDSYTDEFGEISPIVYEAAGRIWPKAQDLALRLLRDVDRGRTLLFKATAIVTRLAKDDPGHIKALDGYLLVTFKRLVLHELKGESGHADGNQSALFDSLALATWSSKRIEKAVLVQQVVARMNPEVRKTFELRALGYSFVEIAKHAGQPANILRKRFSDELKRLIAECNPRLP